VRWRNQPIPKEAQSLAWQRLPHIDVAPMLPANGPILRALALPTRMGISDAASRGEHLFFQALDAAVSRGLRMVMVREKQMSEAELANFTSEVLRRCAANDVLVMINGNINVARMSGVSGLHLPAAQLMPLTERPAVDWCSASCHDERELAHAVRLNLDFVVVGPVCATPSHPDSTPLGWARLARLIARYPLPVYALGGLSAQDLRQARAAGAHGVAMIRGAWEPAYS
jgi:8-oxo-dGTP diphosphatase